MRNDFLYRRPRMPSGKRLAIQMHKMKTIRTLSGEVTTGNDIEENGGP